VTAPNLRWRAVDVGALIVTRVRSDIPVRVDNDANAAAWAEFRFGEHQRDDSFVMITVGTGIGGGLVMNGQLLLGATGAAGEIGHMPHELGGLSCPCGSCGCWERYASGSTLHRLAAAAGWDDRTAGRDVLAATDSDPTARQLVGEVAGHLARGISLLSAALNPTKVVLGGGLGSDPRFVSIVNDALTIIGTTPPRLRPTVVPATLGSLAGAIGAADLAGATPPEPSPALEDLRSITTPTQSRR
jgi:glucokinase